MILKPKKIKSHCFHIFPVYLPWSVGIGCYDLHIFRMLSFKPTFSLSSFTLIKRLISSSSLSAIRVVSSSYLKLLIFLPAILIPGYECIYIHTLHIYTQYFIYIHTYNGILLNHKSIKSCHCYNISAIATPQFPWGNYATWIKSERQISYDFTYMWKLKTKTNEQAKQKQPHRHREQTGGCPKGGEWGDEWTRWRGLRGTNFQS